MKKRKLFASIMALILAAVTLLSLVAGALIMVVNAQKSSGEIQAEIDKLEEEKEKIDGEIEELEGQISENMGEIEKIVAQKNIIDQEVFLLHEQVNNINEQITAYGALIADKQAQLDEALARQEELAKKNKERIRAMEENGRISYWSVLFKANSFSDLLDRLNMIEEIARSDRARLKAMADAAREVEKAKTELETEKAALEESKKQLSASQETLQEKRKEADRLLNELVAKGVEYDALMEEAEKKASEMDAQIDAKEGELDEAKEREYQEWLAQQKPPEPTDDTPGGGHQVVDGLTWITPINYVAFTSPFGWRTHPVYGTLRFHYGVDLAAPEGTPIVATRSGVISRTGYDDASGHHVYINHQDGFSSRYLHMTHYIVSPGEWVAAGQVIGYCGSTGASTGPHLHFGLYYNGSAVNPALYLNI